ncbi:hypothetical protein V8E53_015926 [Lactarius tabidus]
MVLVHAPGLRLWRGPREVVGLAEAHELLLGEVWWGSINVQRQVTTEYAWCTCMQVLQLRGGSSRVVLMKLAMRREAEADYQDKSKTENSLPPLGAIDLWLHNVGVSILRPQQEFTRPELMQVEAAKTIYPKEGRLGACDGSVPQPNPQIEHPHSQTRPNTRPSPRADRVLVGRGAVTARDRDWGNPERSIEGLGLLPLHWQGLVIPLRVGNFTLANSRLALRQWTTCCVFVPFKGINEHVARGGHSGKDGFEVSVSPVHPTFLGIYRQVLQIGPFALATFLVYAIIYHILYAISQPTVVLSSQQ